MPNESNENSVRMQCFKNKGKDVQEMRKKRAETNIELRKAKKEEQYLKRRNVDLSDSPVSPLQERNLENSFSLSEICHGMQVASSLDSLLQYTRGARKMLSKEENPPIDLIVEAGLVPRFVELLQCVESPDLQYEAAWALTNIASGSTNQTQIVVDEGAVIPLVNLLSSPKANVREQAVWALGNIAGDSAVFRDAVLKGGILDPLIGLINSDTPLSLLKNVTWVLSNLCRHKKPATSLEVIVVCIPVLGQLIHHFDHDVIVDATWALSYLSDGADERLQKILDANLLPRLIELLDCNTIKIVTPALRTIGNLVTGNDLQTQCVIDAGVLPILKKLLHHEKPNIVKESAWSLSNITAGTSSQIQRFIDTGCIPLVIDLLQNSDYKIQKECIWVLTNLTSGGSLEQIIDLCNCGGIAALCGMLIVKDPKVVLVVLDALNNILRASSEHGSLSEVTMHIEECGGLDKLEQLQEHGNNSIYQKCYYMITEFFSDENVEDDNLLPQENADQFEFTGTSMPSDGFTL